MGGYIDVATSPQNSYQRVREFHLAFGHPVLSEPRIPGKDRVALRIELIEEELKELKDAIEDNDIVEIADALGDLDYVVNGAALEFGINLSEVTSEIHRSNMTKLGRDGRPVYRTDGKVLKGPDYEPPDLVPVLGL